MRLSERLGVTPARSLIQVRDLDLTTRSRLWSAVLQVTPDSGRYVFSSTWMYGVYSKLWAHYLKLPLDEMPVHDQGVRDLLKHKFLKGRWYEPLEILEFMLNDGGHDNPGELSRLVSKVLDEEKAGLRLRGTHFIEITDEREIAAIEDAVSASADEFTPVRQHLEAALRLYSDRKAPDYRNSIKESISSVEAAVQILTRDPNAELGKALAMLSSKAPLHGAFASALKSLYGYTSDSNGIRHALTEEPSVDAADAKFMLVACAAFVVYLRQKAAL
jgi:hypothetical protein